MCMISAPPSCWRFVQYAAGIAGGGSDSEEDDSDDDGSEGDDEQDGLEDDGPDGVVVGSGRYKLRDRELVTIKRPPPPPGTGGTEVARWAAGLHAGMVQCIALLCEGRLLLGLASKLYSWPHAV
jgi:hypothetical protein